MRLLFSVSAAKLAKEREDDYRTLAFTNVLQSVVTDLCVAAVSREGLVDTLLPGVVDESARSGCLLKHSRSACRYDQWLDMYIDQKIMDLNARPMRQLTCQLAQIAADEMHWWSVLPDSQ